MKIVNMQEVPKISDLGYMKILVTEAEKNLESNNYPVAAGLVIDGEMIGLLSNRLIDHKNWMSHAEILILQQHSDLLRERTMELTTHPGQFTLYTTLEPCIMCFGAAVMSRIYRIVYACPDPRGGATHIKREEFGDFYQKHWPVVEQGPMLQQSYDLIIKYYTRQPEPYWPEIQRQFEAGMTDYLA